MTVCIGGVYVCYKCVCIVDSDEQLEFLEIEVNNKI